MQNPMIGPKTTLGSIKGSVKAHSAQLGVTRTTNDRVSAGVGSHGVA